MRLASVALSFMRSVNDEDEEGDEDGMMWSRDLIIESIMNILCCIR